MKMSRERILQITCAFLAIALLFFVVFGCRCQPMEGFASGGSKKKAAPKTAAAKKAAPTKQKFTDYEENENESESEEAFTDEKDAAEGKKPASKPMTINEKDLFGKLVSEKFTENDITKMIKDGVITEKMIDKFMDQIQSNPKSVAETFMNKKEKEEELEGFTGDYGSYATAAWGKK